MTALERYRAVVADVRYREGWTLAVREDGDRCYLQVQFVAECAVSGRIGTQHGRKWFLSPHMTVSEIVGTAFKACLTAEEHECREAFRFRGQRVFTPHLDVEWMAERMNAGDVERARVDARSGSDRRNGMAGAKPSP